MAQGTGPKAGFTFAADVQAPEGRIRGAQIIGEAIAKEGIDTIFTVYAGPTAVALPYYTRAGGRVIGCRHEEQAAFMAQAWGYINRKPGVVITGTGPGTSNTVTPMHVATMNCWPLVVIGGSAGSTSHWKGATRGWGGFQEMDQVTMAAPHCKWAVETDTIERFPEILHLGLGRAVSGRPGAVYVDVPGHQIDSDAAADAVEWRGDQPELGRPHGDPRLVERIAELLAEAERPLLLIGKGAAWADAGGPLQRLVARGIPFVPSPMGRGTVPDDDPRCAGSARSTALANADVVIAVGARFNWMFAFGRAPTFAADAKLVQIDIEPEEMFNAAKLHTGLVADCSAAIEQIDAVLEGRPLRSADSGWLERLSESSAKNKAALEKNLASDEVPISPYRLMREIRDFLPRNASISVDGEITLGIGRLVLPSFLPRHRLNSGTTACMGTGVPYAIAAKIARPDEPSVAVLGDYAFGAAGIDIETAARVNAPVVFVISNNGGIVGRIPQRNNFRPEDGMISALIPAEYQKMAEMVGGYGERVDEPAQIRPALERAFGSGKVAVVNVMVDPEGGARKGGGYLS